MLLIKKVVVIRSMCMSHIWFQLQMHVLIILVRHIKMKKNIAKVTYEENNKEHKVQEHIYYISMRTCRQEWSTKNMKHNNMIRLIRRIIFTINFIKK